MRGLEIADAANKLARHMGIECCNASDVALSMVNIVVTYRSFPSWKIQATRYPTIGFNGHTLTHISSFMRGFSMYIYTYIYIYIYIIQQLVNKCRFLESTLLNYAYPCRNWTFQRFARAA